MYNNLVLKRHCLKEEVIVRLVLLYGSLSTAPANIKAARNMAIKGDRASGTAEMTPPQRRGFD